MGVFLLVFVCCWVGYILSKVDAARFPFPLPYGGIKELYADALGWVGPKHGKVDQTNAPINYMYA